MALSYSPLRYPGGKQILSRVLAHLIRMNDRAGGVYVEPYAGGAGAGLALLFEGYVNRLMINDADPRIAAFWTSILRDTDRFLALLESRPIAVDEWQRQRKIYQNHEKHSTLKVAFATFYLNRCNRSGIIANGGLIGGKDQAGKWKIDARFNRRDLRLRIERIARYAERIECTGEDALVFLRRLRPPAKNVRYFLYLDPPYYRKGAQLYMNHYSEADHARLADVLRSGMGHSWVLSYDNVGEVRSLYSGFSRVEFDLGYSARAWRTGSELLIFDESLRFPRPWRKRIPANAISTAVDLAGLPS